MLDKYLKLFVWEYGTCMSRVLDNITNLSFSLNDRIYLRAFTETKDAFLLIFKVSQKYGKKYGENA